MLSPKRTMSQLIQLWAKDPERAARLASSGLSSMWGIREFAAGGKVVPFISRGVRDFRSDLLSKVRARSEEIARKTEEYQGWQFEPGDRIMGDKGVYTILGRTWDTKRDRPMYRYETSGIPEDQEGWHQSMFDAEKAHQSLKKMTGPIKKAKGGSISRALRAMRGPEVPNKLSPPEIIKEPGGNWLSGSVERSLGNLKTHVTHPPVGQRIGEHVVTQQMIDDYVASSPDKGLNDWIDKQLTRYIKNDMGTARDPIRKMAEEGVLHVDPDQLNIRENWTPGPYSLGVLGQSPEARRWEGIVDNTIAPTRVDAFREKVREANPWMEKLAPRDLVYEFWDYHSARDLGLTHLTDELRNALNPESGLPANLLLNPRSMSRLSVPQAVQRVHDINKWRAEQKVKANLLRAGNPATVLYKGYPENNPLGLRWVELKAPKPDPATHKAGKIRGRDVLLDENGMEVVVDRAALQDALNYEGEMMKHCVSGYCEDVISGGTRIFSLRDEAGEPHVTIEVRSGFPAERSKISGEMLPPGLPYIKQVKGKGNSRPSEKYLPFVDDFIKTQGPWYKVEDIHHTGLRQRDQVFNPTEIKTLEGLGVSDIPDYLTREEIETLQKMFTQRKSSGGSVMDPTWHMMNMIYG